MYIVCEEYLNKPLLFKLKEHLREIRIKSFNDISKYYNDNLIFFLKKFDLQLVNRLNAEKNKFNDILIFTNSKLTSSERAYFSNLNIFIFNYNESEFINDNTNGSIIENQELFDFLDEKIKTIIEFFKTQNNRELLVNTFFDLIWNYHYILLSVVNYFLEKLNSYTGVTPYINLMLLREDYKFTVIGNTNEIITKKDYDIMELKTGFSTMDNFDYQLSYLNAYDRSPEYKYVLKRKIDNTTLYFIQYYIQFPFLNSERRTLINKNLDLLQLFLERFGICGEKTQTGITRLLKIVSLYEREAGNTDYSKKIAFNCKMLARNAGLSPEEIKKAEFAGKLHSIGKILTSESEADLYPNIGYMILRKIDGFIDISNTILNQNKTDFSDITAILFIAKYIENCKLNNKDIDVLNLRSLNFSQKIKDVLNSDLKKY